MPTEDTPKAADAATLMLSAIEEQFSTWASLPKVRAILRASVGGKVKRRDLMLAAYGAGVSAGVSAMDASSELGLERALRCYACECDRSRFETAYETASMLDGYDPAVWRDLAAVRGCHHLTGKPIVSLTVTMRSTKAEIFAALEVEGAALGDAAADAVEFREDVARWKERADIFERRLVELRDRFTAAGMVGAADLVGASLRGELTKPAGEASL